MANPTRFTDLDVAGYAVVYGDLGTVGDVSIGGACAITGVSTIPQLKTSVTALTKTDSYALAAAEKTLVVTCDMGSAASKVLTLGLAAGQVAIVKNAGSAQAFTVKNIAADTGTSLATGKSLLVVGSATANASIVIALD